MRLQYWIAYILGIGGTAIYIALILTCIAPVETEGLTDGQYMWTMLKFLAPLMVLPMIGVGFGMSAGWKNRALMARKG